VTALTISSLSRVMVQVPVTARLNGSPNYDPTGDVVAMAFIPGPAKPDGDDWHVGSWGTDPGPTYLAQCLVGPDAVELTPGTYQIWVKVTDAPEQPVMQAGQLVIE
jgi:hypothetical protein